MKSFLLYISFVLVGLVATAQTPEIEADNQPNPKKEEKLKALYVAYITKQLNLTPDEAQKFWPIHAQYEAELNALNATTTDELAKQQAVLNIKKKYQTNFNKLLGTDRSNSFYKQDAEFRQKLIQRLKQMRQQRMNNAGRPEGKPPRSGGMRKNMLTPN
jgi:Spy/CpxP family protein refolding chaperone